MALLPTLLAIGIGVGLGLYWGGRISNLLAWVPPLWEALVAGVVLNVLLDVLPWSGAIMTFLSILATGALLAFAVVNVRIGGMVLVVVGLGLNLFVTVINWGMPVSTSALASAGIVSEAQVDELVLTGGREAASGALFGFLGDVIPLPWGQVISIGDVLVLIGLALVVASILRRYEVGRPSGTNRQGRGGSGDYRSALDALGRGPAPRRGPGLHPSRMGSGSGGRRRR
ncbi:DUF5317 family protein [Dermatobacter hominis]|uniref:DUF5317 family protein n=1 Tax=Dermatobacter hominis TaxID=2884263 RepID=UPI001D12F80A|nr:DUF5317 family protein [Dermatobacter hominis]UDY37294.1 DUF5317 domain-containing protein [Dermatobacter hominis]